MRTAFATYLVFIVLGLTYCIAIGALQR